jgi:hypothetical protein
MMSRPPALVVTVIALVASGCLGGSAGECNDQGGSCRDPTAPTPTGELRGLVVMQGGPALVNPTGTLLKNARIALTITTPTGGRYVSHPATDAHGRFSLRLPPGWYTLTARFNYPLLPPLAAVQVKADQVVRVRFTEAIK